MRHAIPQELIDQVLQQTDIVEVIGRYMPLDRNGRYWKGLCPFHGEKTPSFTVTPEKRIFHCFGCKAGGNAIQFVMQIDQLSFAEAVQQLAEQAGIPATGLLAAGPEDEEEQLRRNMREAHEVAKTFYHYLLKHTEEGQAARDYLAKRQFSDAMADALELGYAPARKDALVRLLEKKQFDLQVMEQAGLVMRTENGQWIDRFRDRLMFPITDAKGRYIAFGGRILGDGQPKYLNSSDSPVFHKGRVLYHLANAKTDIRSRGEAILFEGYADVLRAREAGVNNGVASLGTAFTPEHAAILKRIASQVTICYDGDEAGQTAAEKAIPVLQKQGFRVRIARLPVKEDPDTFILKYGPEKFLELLNKHADGVPAFHLLRMRHRFRMDDAEGRLAYIQQAVSYLASLDMPAEREYYTGELARQMQLPLAVLQEQMAPLLRNKPDSLTRHQQSNLTDEAPDGRGNPFHRQPFPARQPNRSQQPKGSGQWKDSGRRGKGRQEEMPDPWAGMDVRLTPQDQPQPAHIKAEQHLLGLMLSDAELARYVQEAIGEHFNLELHAALASYLYAYYAAGNAADGSQFLTFLDDKRLERLASGLMMNEYVPVTETVLKDYVKLILQDRPRQEQIRELTERMQLLERSGDIKGAGEISLQLLALKQQLQRGTRG